MTAGTAFTHLVEVMARLRAPGGCPWDREQTHKSIKPYLIEEAYEVAEAIEDDDHAELCKELGDLLLQVVFHAQMASEAGRFTVTDVVESIHDKMVRRHPHVFADTEVADSSEVLRNWATIKAEERKDDADRSAIAGVPRGLPALLRAHRTGDKAAHVGFDWRDADGVLAKVDEELAELRAAIGSGEPAAVEAELGDVLMALASLGRHLDVHAEEALQRANDRFARRFRRMEEIAGQDGIDLATATDATLEALWQRAKDDVDEATRP